MFCLIATELTIFLAGCTWMAHHFVFVPVDRWKAPHFVPPLEASEMRKLFIVGAISRPLYSRVHMEAMFGVFLFNSYLTFR
jgi:hypothetical protein